MDKVYCGKCKYHNWSDCRHPDVTALKESDSYYKTTYTKNYGNCCRLNANNDCKKYTKSFLAYIVPCTEESGAERWNAFGAVAFRVAMLLFLTSMALTLMSSKPKESQIKIIPEPEIMEEERIPDNYLFNGNFRR